MPSGNIEHIPEVSAIVNYLNEERFLQEAIDSVFAQTFDDWELLLVDDGSTDGSTAIARTCAAAHPGKVRYLDHPDHANRGMSASRNLGVREARGRYIAYLDGDDVWLPTKLERQIAELRAHPEAAMVCAPLLEWHSWNPDADADQFDRIYGAGPSGRHPYAGSVVEPPELLALFLRDDRYIPAAALIQREAIQRAGFAVEEFRDSYQDAAFFVKFCRTESVLVSPVVGYKYRKHPQSFTTRESRDGLDLQNRMKYLEWIEQYFRQEGYEDPDVWRELRRCLHRVRHPKRSVEWYKGRTERLLERVKRDLPEPFQEAAGRAAAIIRNKLAPEAMPRDPLRPPGHRDGRWSGAVLPADAVPVEAYRWWATLCETHPQFRSPFFSAPFVRAVASVHDGVQVCLIERDGRLVGVLPFQFPSPHARARRVAEPVGADYNDVFGVILEPGLEISPGELLRLAGLRSLRACNIHPRQADLGMTGRNPERGSSIVYGSDPDAYWDRLRLENPHFAAQTERRERKLVDRHGPLRFRLHTEDIEETLEHLIQVKREQYQRTGVPDVMAPEWKRRLMHRLARETDPQCIGALSTVHAGVTWVASHLGLRHGPLLHYWFPVYNPELSRFSPGHILIKQIIEQTPSMGIQELDLGVGEGQHKKSYVRETYWMYEDVWKAPGLRGTLGAFGGRGWA